jgi:xanthine dehydrogenase accessory factor
MSNPGEHVLDAASRWLEKDRKLALATVTETWGSAPQPRGSQLLIDSEGNFLGSVSGGCVEGAVVTEAARVIETGSPKELEFGVSDEMAWEVGLACGGTIRVWVEPLGADGGVTDKQLTGLNKARSARAPVALLTRLDGSGSDLIAIDQIKAQGLLAPDFADAFASDQSRVVEADGARAFLNVFNPALRMVIIGAVHIAQYLAPMAELAGYDVTIIDPREAFASKERFPTAWVHADWPDEVLPGLGLDKRSALVLLTHDPKIDDAALEVALKTDCLYIGALGSRKTHGRRVERLTEAGFSKADIGRIHGPIGLNIGARGPNEIAVAILSQVTAVVRGAEAG